MATDSSHIQTPSSFDPATGELPRLDDACVDVWRASLTPPSEELSRLQRLLSNDESARAARFRFDVHRDRFTAARGLLRLLLGAYTNRDPSTLRLRYREHGKPALVSADGMNSVEFNVSHSADVALFAFSAMRETGVDVEEIRLERDFLDIAERFFSEREKDRLRDASPVEQSDLFFSFWTRKEAYLKARGVGISESLQAIDVSRAGDQGRVDLRVDGTPRESEQAWCLLDLPADDRFKAALCVDRAPETIRLWQAPEVFPDYGEGSSS